MGKCKLMWLGCNKHSQQVVVNMTPVSKICSLGVTFSALCPCDEGDAEALLKGITNTLNIWQQRDLTIKGRITVSKSLLISKTVYMGNMGLIPKRYQRMIQSRIMNFVWRGRPPKVARDILCQTIQNGGLNAIDVEKFCFSLKLSWARKIFQNDEPIWMRLLQARVGKCRLIDLFQTHMNKRIINSFKIAKFYKELLNEFQRYTYRPAKELQQIQKEFIWNNSQIMVRNDDIFRSLYAANIRIIDDLLNSDGTIMSYNQLQSNFPLLRANFLMYEGLKRAIPKMWLAKLKNGIYRRLSETVRNEPYEIIIGDKKIPAKNVGSKHFYLDVLPKRDPKAQTRWEDAGYDINWTQIYKLPYKCTAATKLHALQYRILHRYIPTHRFLYTRGVTDSDDCPKCSCSDTLEYFFLGCSEVTLLWRYVKKILNNSGGKEQISLNTTSVIFGISEGTTAQNCIILLAKQFIVTCKLGRKYVSPSAEKFKLHLKKIF